MLFYTSYDLIGLDNTGTGLDLRDYNSIEVHNHQVHINFMLRSCIQSRCFFQFISQYDIIPETKYRRKCYEALKEKDEMNRQMIAQQVLRAANLFDEIRKLRGKIATYDGITKRNISEILIEHDFFQKAYWTVKNRFLSGEYYYLILTFVLCQYFYKISVYRKH